MAARGQALPYAGTTSSLTSSVELVMYASFFSLTCIGLPGECRDTLPFFPTHPYSTPIHSGSPNPRSCTGIPSDIRTQVLADVCGVSYQARRPECIGLSGTASPFQYLSELERVEYICVLNHVGMLFQDYSFLLMHTFTLKT